MSDPIFNLHDVALLITLAVCLVLTLLQPILSGNNLLASRLLTAFFLTIALSAGCTLLLWNEYLELHSILQHIIPYFLTASLLLKGPILYLYVSALTKEAFSLRRHHAFHLLPTAITALVLAVFTIDTNDLRFTTPGMGEMLPPIIDLIWYSIKIIPLVYSIAAVINVHRYQQQLMNHYSNFATPAPGWLNNLTLGFALAWAWTLIVSVLGNLLSFPLAVNLGIADNYVTFVLVIALFAYSISYAHHLLTTRDEDAESGNMEEKPADATIEKVRRGIENEKLYLQQNLTIEDFSKQIGVPYREVSYAINKHFGSNFFEFINSHRVEEAKRLLIDKSYAHLTILDVLLESGFNSKSAFQRFFKRLAGVSPSEYRKTAQTENMTSTALRQP